MRLQFRMLSAKAANLLVWLQISVSALAASQSAPPILLFNHLDANVTLPQNLSAVPTPNDLPPNFWNYSIPGPGNRQVTFYNYGYPLNRQELDEVIELAYKDATFRHHASELITPQQLEYLQPGPGTRLILSFFAGPHTTWGEWANTAVGLEEFALRWDNVALNFVLSIIGGPGLPLALGIGTLRIIVVP